MWTSFERNRSGRLARPRLPGKEDLPPESYRISDTEAEQLRYVSHPFFFKWQVVTVPLVLAHGVLAVADRRAAPRTDFGRESIRLGIRSAAVVDEWTLLGCLLKLVITWFKCRQILVGLDRLPLRHAFGSMKRLSWKSLWTPGGSTLRETYKIMSRALENLARLRRV